MSEQNPDLLAVSADINEAMAALRARKKEARNATELQGLNASLRDLNQRLQAVNGLLFAERSDAIGRAAGEVAAATADLAQAIRSAEQVNQVIASVTGFLGLVDRVVRVASGGLAGA